MRWDFRLAKESVVSFGPLCNEDPDADGEGKDSGTARPVVRKKRIGEAKASNAFPGVLNNCSRNAYILIKSASGTWPSPSSGCVGGGVVAISLQL